MGYSSNRLFLTCEVNVERGVKKDEKVERRDIDREQDSRRKGRKGRGGARRREATAAGHLRTRALETLDTDAWELLTSGKGAENLCQTLLGFRG